MPAQSRDDVAPSSSPHPPRELRLLPLDLVRGFMIGSAELVPGVSGGTVALVTGVYEQLISSASHVIGAARVLVTGPDRKARAMTELRRTDWRLVIPVLVGMVLAVFTVAGVMEAFVTDYPEHARGLFFGLVAASIVVPIRMVPPARRAVAYDVGLAALAAVAAFLLVSLAGGGSTTDPSLFVVFLAAAVAICALVVPGVSGSFLLLAVGLYTVTLTAVDERNLAYIGVFAAGATFGLASFVPLLARLLRNHRRVTLVIMTGLMLGSLRALWPWQAVSGADDHGGPGALIAPTDPVLGPLLLALLGVVIVLSLVWIQARSERD